MGYGNVDFVYPLDPNKIHNEPIKINIMSTKILPETLKIENRLSSPLPQMVIAGNKL